MWIDKKCSCLVCHDTNFYDWVLLNVAEGMERKILVTVGEPITKAISISGVLTEEVVKQVTWSIDNIQCLVTYFG